MTSTEYTPCHVVPKGYAALACQCVLPDTWTSVPLPAAEYDFSNPAVFVPLLIASAPYGAVLFTIAARPKFEAGCVEDWARYLSEHNSLSVENMQESRIGRMPCVLGNATMETEAGRMRSRSAFLEDGGRLYNIGVLAPEPIWLSLEPTLQHLIDSFALDDVQGISAVLMREMREVVEPVAETGEETSSSAVVTGSAPAAEPEATVPMDVSLANDTSSLDPDNEMNIRLRDSGAGLVPRVIAMNEMTKQATVGAGAIEGLITVPFGWHVIDDGRRTLVFDQPGRVQISLDLRSAGPDEHFGLLEGIGDELAAAHPTAEFLKMMISELPCLAVRNLPVGTDVLQQAYVVRSSHRDDMALLCRVTSDDPHMTLAMNVAEVILTTYSAQPSPMGTPNSAPVRVDDSEFAGKPAWWRTAVELERANQLPEAEQIMLSAIDHNGVYSSLAHLYELRMARLLDDGDRKGAESARLRAIHWLDTYASSATSGGEGAAQSYERDQLVAALGGPLT